MPVITVHIDTEQWAVVPKSLLTILAEFAANGGEDYLRAAAMDVVNSAAPRPVPAPIPTSYWISLAEKAPDCLEVRIKLLDGSEINCWAQSDGDFYWKNRSGEHFICESDVTHWRHAEPDGGAV